jgi:hypothetical protein
MYRAVLVGGSGDGREVVSEERPNYTLKYVRPPKVLVHQYGDFPDEAVPLHAGYDTYHFVRYALPWPTRWVPWIETQRGTWPVVGAWVTQARAGLIMAALKQFNRADARARVQVKDEVVLRHVYVDGPFDNPSDDEDKRRRIWMNLRRHRQMTRHALRERRKWKWQVERLLLPANGAAQIPMVAAWAFPLEVIAVPEAEVPDDYARELAAEWTAEWSMRMAT